MKSKLVYSISIVILMISLGLGQTTDTTKSRMAVWYVKSDMELADSTVNLLSWNLNKTINSKGKKIGYIGVDEKIFNDYYQLFLQKREVNTTTSSIINIIKENQFDHVLFWTLKQNRNMLMEIVDVTTQMPIMESTYSTMGNMKSVTNSGILVAFGQLKKSPSQKLKHNLLKIKKVFSSKVELGAMLCSFLLYNYTISIDQSADQAYHNYLNANNQNDTNHYREETIQLDNKTKTYTAITATVVVVTAVNFFRIYQKNSPEGILYHVAP